MKETYCKLIVLIVEIREWISRLYADEKRCIPFFGVGSFPISWLWENDVSLLAQIFDTLWLRRLVWSLCEMPGCRVGFRLVYMDMCEGFRTAQERQLHEERVILAQFWLYVILTPGSSPQAKQISLMVSETSVQRHFFLTNAPYVLHPCKHISTLIAM